jgi:hypothetical protein
MYYKRENCGACSATKTVCGMVENEFICMSCLEEYKYPENNAMEECLLCGSIATHKVEITFKILPKKVYFDRNGWLCEKCPQDPKPICKGNCAECWHKNEWCCGGFC